jgi:homoserine O-acetyltransferase
MGEIVEVAPAPSVRPSPAPVTPSTGPPVLGGGRIVSSRLGPFRLESGEVLPDLVVAYRHDGPPPPAPQVLVVHALTGSADAAGDWWQPLIGPGRALDTGTVGVVCANLLGGRYGTTGPTSIDPRSGLPYGPGFPAVTTRDQARAIWALLEAVGIERVALATGGSLGGMVALETAIEHPDRVGVVVPLAAPAATGAMAMAWNHLQVRLVEHLGSEGLALARQLAMTTYRSEADFNERFGRRAEVDGRPSVVSYLEHQGAKLVGRFDPETYRILTRAMDSHDIGRDRGGPTAAMRRLARSRVRLVGVGIEGDILFGPDQVRALVDAAAGAGVEAAYWELRSVKGHDAFLVEWTQLGEVLHGALTSA